MLLIAVVDVLLHDDYTISRDGGKLGVCMVKRNVVGVSCEACSCVRLMASRIAH